jgi:ribose-phosphate pyrophosphokinase
MMFLGMPGNDNLAHELARLTAAEMLGIESRRFPDGESYVRIHGAPNDQDTYLVCTLADPDRQVLPLLFAARTMREMGAKSLTLIAPYLAYLRQDAEFQKGEAVSSRIFADLISREFDSLITVDPHLHRFRSLDEIYSIPTRIIRTSELIGTWVREHVSSPVILGPDAESAQWVEAIAASAACPWSTFKKERHGDRNVQLLPPPGEFRDRTPVLIDDVISSGATMISAAQILAAEQFSAPYCIAIHGLFDAATANKLRALTRAVLTTDTVAHPSNYFRIAPLIVDQLATA